ncbi:MAG: tryptophan--tRNA ligase, partial [Planctomycetota bacterium]
AADILAYGSDTVPVGADQTQHIEVTRDIAKAFNSAFGEEVFVLPKAKVLDESAKVPGTDGEKMSKSYGNFIEVFEPVKQMKKKVMRIATDSRPMEDPKDPDTDHLFQLFCLFGDEGAKTDMADMYRRGGFGYGDVKKALAEAAESYFEEPRQRREEMEAHPDKVREILGDGAAKARAKASQVLLSAQQACGLKR